MVWADFVLFAPGRALSSEVMKSAKNVKLMQLWSSGYDKFNIKDSIHYKIPVANNGGGNAISVAEHTILLMLSVCKWLPDSHSRTVEGRWEGNSHGIDMLLLNKKTKARNYTLETINKKIYIFGIAMDKDEKKEVINEANKIYDVEKVFPSIYLATDLSRNKL